MMVTKQLYQLQEVDQALNASIKTLERITSQIGESQGVLKVKGELALEHQCLEKLKREQHAGEWGIDDLRVKITAAEESLYSGRITNPKELSNLQHEVEGLKLRRNQLEDRTLGLMEQVDRAEANVSSLKIRLNTLEAEWSQRQEKLSSEAEKLRASISELEHKRELLLADIDSEAVSIYQELKKQRGQAVAKIAQGICGGCRISLPMTLLQRARSGNLIKCSSCGRILFLD